MGVELLEDVSPDACGTAHIQVLMREDPHTLTELTTVSRIVLTYTDRVSIEMNVAIMPDTPLQLLSPPVIIYVLRDDYGEGPFVLTERASLQDVNPPIIRLYGLLHGGRAILGGNDGG